MDCRYKFANAEWSVSGTGEPRIKPRSVWHTEREASGSTWMSRPISFDFVKVTNNINDNESSHVSDFSTDKDLDNGRGYAE